MPVIIIYYFDHWCPLAGLSGLQVDKPVGSVGVPRQYHSPPFHSGRTALEAFSYEDRQKKNFINNRIRSKQQQLSSSPVNNTFEMVTSVSAAEGLCRLFYVSYNENRN